MGKAPLPHNKRNCYPPYPDHYLIASPGFIESFFVQGEKGETGLPGQDGKVGIKVKQDRIKLILS